MKAYVLSDFNGRLNVSDVSAPRPNDHEVCIEVKAIGLNPIDLALQRGQFAGNAKPPLILGSDVAGTVSELGAKVQGFAIGDRVAGLINFPGVDGTVIGRGYATRAVAPVSHFAHIPSELTYVQAAALPMVGLTVRKSILAGNVRPGQRVLVHGGSGGVGHLAIQFAKNRGAFVVATASAKNLDFMRRLGADQVIDYAHQDFEHVVKDIDIAIVSRPDTTALRTLSVMNKNGVIIMLWPIDDTLHDAAALEGIAVAFVGVESSGKELAEIFRQAAAGNITATIARVYPFAQLPEALEQLRRGGTPGKIVVSVLP